MTNQLLEQYNQSLDIALTSYMSGDGTPFEEFCQEWALVDKIPNNPFAKHGAVMKLVTARTSLPMDIRSKAKIWLVENGFRSWDDGDVPVDEQKEIVESSYRMADAMLKKREKK